MMIKMPIDSGIINDMSTIFDITFTDRINKYYKDVDFTNSITQTSFNMFEDIMKEHMFYNEELFLYGDFISDGTDAIYTRYQTIGELIAIKCAERVIMFSMSKGITPIANFGDTYSENSHAGHNITIEGTYGNENIGENYSANENAPINSTIDNLTTPSGKIKHTLSNNSTSTENKRHTDLINGGKTSNTTKFDSQFKMLEFYLFNGNVLYSIISSEIQKYIYDKISLW